MNYSNEIFNIFQSIHNSYYAQIREQIYVVLMTLIQNTILDKKLAAITMLDCR